MSNLNPGGLTRVLNYIKTWVTGLLNDKANSSTTLSGYGITDAYTKTEVDAKFQYVTELPASPVEGVTYFILENEE